MWEMKEHEEELLRKLEAVKGEKTSLIMQEEEIVNQIENNNTKINEVRDKIKELKEE
jgi:hypothetical protein